MNHSFTAWVSLISAIIFFIAIPCAAFLIGKPKDKPYYDIWDVVRIILGFFIWILIFYFSQKG